MEWGDKILTGDIEAVGLLPDIRPGHREDIHVIHLKDYDTGELYTFFDEFDDRINPQWLDDYETGFKAGDIMDGVRAMEKCKVLIFQNISGFDAIALEKTVGFKRNHFERRKDTKFPYKTMDTLTMSQLLNPERKLPQEAYALGIASKVGPHSIAAHGIRIGRYKPDHEDWSHLSPEMIHRVEEDVEIGEDFYTFLLREMDEQSKRTHPITGLDIYHAYYCELRMAFAVARQAERGFAFDVKYAGDLVSELDELINTTERNFRPHMPRRLKMKKLSETQIEGNADKMAELGFDPVEYENYMFNGDSRASDKVTYWSIVTSKGKYIANLTKSIPEARGFMQDYGDNPPVHGPCTPLTWEDIPLGNRDAVKQVLYKHGWRGVNYNDTETEYMEANDGQLPKPWSGKIDDDSIKLWEDRTDGSNPIPEWCRGIAEWYVYQSRRTQILNLKDTEYFDANGKWPRQSDSKNGCRGLLPKARCFDKGSAIEGMSAERYYEIHKHWPTSGHWRVPAIAFHCATNTFRMRHKVVVNIPSRGLYGKEMRGLFIAAPGHKVLGCDGSGLELRMLAHFMNDEEYTSQVLDGDIHTYNQIKAALKTRDMAKKFIYMFLYGAGIPNLSQQIGIPNREMEESVESFKRELPKLADLLERVERAGKRFGYLLSVDGRWGRIRSRGGELALHTALNVLLQMTGSLTMKWAHIEAEDMAVQRCLIDSVDDFPIVAHVHDEAQMEVKEDEVESIHYVIDKEDWKSEEKREFFDEEGRMWSAPRIIDDTTEGEDRLIIQRLYHPIGECYARGIKAAGELLCLNIETAGEYMIGDSWRDTH